MINGRKEFGKWFKNELKKRGLRQNRFAEMVGVNFRTVNHWCKGDNYPDNEIQSEIDKALGKAPGYINTIINKFRNEENGISDNDFNIILNVVRELKRGIYEFATEDEGELDMADFEKIIDNYRNRKLEDYSFETGIEPIFYEKLHNVSNLDIFVYLFLHTSNKEFTFNEYVNRFIQPPHLKRVRNYHKRLLGLMEGDKK